MAHGMLRSTLIVELERSTSALSSERRVQTATKLMLGFAERTLDTPDSERRYLWTDAFAVCNFLSLARATGDPRHEELAFRLIDRVHHVLGRFRDGDLRAGWLSGLSPSEGERHPTLGGLRIGKALPERRPEEPYDAELEWERDGQYFHYLTQWMHALNRASLWSGNPELNLWARELAATACKAFDDRRGALFWKMSVDLSRPVVPGKSLHDPLDGYVVCAELRATAQRFQTITSGPSLDVELATLARMSARGDPEFAPRHQRDSRPWSRVREEWATPDPLGIGGLLVAGSRLSQLLSSGALSNAELLDPLLASALSGLRSYVSRPELGGPPSSRLAFRELGLAIGLAGVDALRGANRGILLELRDYAPLRAGLENFWLSPAAQRASTWREHRDINEVMLATSLVPDEFLA